MPTPWEELLPRLAELEALAHALRLMEWDQAVVMPPGGAQARARASASLQGIAHERLTHPRIGELIEELRADASLGDEQKAHVRALARDYDKAVKVPEDLVRALAETRALAYHAWTEARPGSDFLKLQPHLEKLIALKREEADAVGWEEERYDALLDDFEPGMTTRTVEKMFAELVDGLIPLSETVLDVAGSRPDFLDAPYDESAQKRFCDWIVGVLGFDSSAGRLDKSPHPFTIKVAYGDVRQTTRTEPRTVLNSIYAAIHETGHALYEQGIPESLSDLPAGHVASLGLHESQSRMWENQVGRGRAFCDFILPHLKDRFTELGAVTHDEFHRGVIHPQRTLIRVYADEVTYNLHVAMRFEIELQLFRGEMEVSDLPRAWNDAMEAHLGMRPGNDADGVLQDMHWSIGALGYFPTYTLGTLYAAAFYRRADDDLGGLDDDLRSGNCSRLLEWARERIHRHAFTKPAADIAEPIIGGPIGAGPFLDYLRHKYSAAYDVAV